MDFKTILFSKQHLAHPFTLNYGKKISIENKKIQTIALSILAGLFTAGIGGVLVFYCLSAKYKIEKLPCERKKFINHFVSSFLHPYITGQITKETDPKNRKPMIEMLLEKLPKFELSKKDEIEEMALNIFFEKVALGLYVHQKLGARPYDITSQSKEFEILITALKESLPREFPNKKISDKDLRIKASKALDIVNKEREQIKEEALNFKKTGKVDLRALKFYQLQTSGKLFLV